MNIEINNFTKSRVDKKYFQKIGEIVLKKLKQPKNVGISLVFVGDKRIKRLNKKYRGKNKTTDVLSFAYQEKEFLGDIIISIPQAKKQAKTRSYPLKRELLELFVHGILHLVGYEDETEKGYREMIEKQNEILGYLNF